MDNGTRKSRVMYTCADIKFRMKSFFWTSCILLTVFIQKCEFRWPLVSIQNAWHIRYEWILNMNGYSGSTQKLRLMARHAACHARHVLKLWCVLATGTYTDTKPRTRVQLNCFSKCIALRKTTTPPTPILFFLHTNFFFICFLFNK